MTDVFTSKIKILAGSAACLALAVILALYYRECGKNEKLAAQLREAQFVSSHKDLAISGLRTGVSALLTLARSHAAILAESRKSAVERADILKNAKPEVRRSTERVIDAATRKKVADRLNRPLP